MSVSINLHDLLDAYEWVSAGEVAFGCEAYINRKTGSLHWHGEGVDEALPENIDDGSLYIAVPREREFDLSRSLALRFVEEHIPQHREAVYGFFQRKGAYAHFNSLLARAGQLDAWHKYENLATENALCEWCTANGFEPVVQGVVRLPPG